MMHDHREPVRAKALILRENDVSIGSTLILKQPQHGKTDMLPLISHDSHLKTGWDLLVAATVFASAIILPYRMVAGTDPSGLLYGLATVVLGLDVLVNLNTRVTAGLLRMDDRAAVARHYLATWLVPDLLATLPLAAIVPGGLAATAAGRLLLLLRLLRLFKLPFTFKRFREMVPVPPALTRLAMFLAWFALLTHFMSLGWLAIGAVAIPAGFADRYLRALYWCITTITTIGYGDYGPDHGANLQILYTIGVQLVGVGMFSYIIGNVATLVVNLDSARAAFQARVEEVCDGMRSRRLPGTLQERVRNYYRYLWETRKGLSSAAFMQDLPEPLRLDISLHLNRDLLDKVTMFQDADEGFARAVVGRLEPVVFLPGDFIIRQGEYGRCMYFLSRGEVEVLVDGNVVAALPGGAAFGEASLLRGEKRNASVRALAYCDAYRLSSEEFDALRTQFPEFDRKIQTMMEARLGHHITLEETPARDHERI